jgi:hypothetical protein
MLQDVRNNQPDSIWLRLLGQRLNTNSGYGKVYKSIDDLFKVENASGLDFYLDNETIMIGFSNFLDLSTQDAIDDRADQDLYAPVSFSEIHKYLKKNSILLNLGSYDK